MFCKHCGNKINDGATYCPICGGELGKKVAAPSNWQIASDKIRNFNQVKKKKMSPKKTKKIKILAGIICIVIVTAFIGNYIYNMDCKHVVNKYMKLMAEEDYIQKEYKLLPEEYQQYMINSYKEDNDGADEAEMLEEKQKDYEDGMQLIENEYGENWKYSFEIKKVEDASRKEIREWKQNLEDSNVKVNRKIKGMKNVTVKFRLQSEDGEKNDKTDMDLIVVRLGHKWYMAKTGW